MMGGLANLFHRQLLVTLVILGMMFQEAHLSMSEVQSSHAESRRLSGGTRRLAVGVNRPLHRENELRMPMAWATGTMTLCETCHRKHRYKALISKYGILLIKLSQSPRNVPMSASGGNSS
ncbi:hypothetical protein EDD15DRAFT_1023158 [Pisolithus albus]|nr:hypothetical protein EDD15DRAFT_1023158 [Pisolithus albus]